MFKLFKSDSNFCEVSVIPWILFIACSCFIILGWGIYQYGFETDTLMETLNRKMPEDARILTNFSPSQQTFQTSVQQQGQLRNQTNYSASPRVRNGIKSNFSLHTIEDTFKQAIAAIHPSVVNIKSLKRNGSVNQNGS